MPPGGHWELPLVAGLGSTIQPGSGEPVKTGCDGDPNCFQRWS